MRPLLALLVLLPASFARAGTYVRTYSGGASVRNGVSYPYVESAGTDSYGSGGGTYDSCDGEIATTFVWDPAYPGEPAPPVVVDEWCVAAFGWPGGACDDAFDDPPSLYGAGASEGGTLDAPVHHYHIEQPDAGGAIALHRTPSADTGALAGSYGFCSVSYHASVSPVTIESDYAVKDDDGSFNFLVGQQADFYVSAGGYQVQLNGNWVIGADYVGGVAMSSNNSTRETTQYADLSVKHPSVYFEGEEHPGASVSCSVILYDSQSNVAAVMNLTRQVNVARPSVSMVVDTLGPCTIYDGNRYGDQDHEKESAADPSDPTSGFWIHGNMTLPELFTSQEGDGEWGYAQKETMLLYKNASVDHNDALGLDNVYPYPGVVGSREDFNYVDWRVIHNGTLGSDDGRLDFYDAPDSSIDVISSYEEDFEGYCYAVLRPPHQFMQSTVELPMQRVVWDYESASQRSTSGYDWLQVGAYRPYGGEWLTTPTVGSITQASSLKPVPSYDMDWDHVNMNVGW